MNEGSLGGVGHDRVLRHREVEPVGATLPAVSTVQDSGAHLAKLPAENEMWREPGFQTRAHLECIVGFKVQFCSLNSRSGY